MEIIKSFKCDVHIFNNYIDVFDVYGLDKTKWIWLFKFVYQEVDYLIRQLELGIIWWGLAKCSGIWYTVVAFKESFKGCYSWEDYGRETYDKHITPSLLSSNRFWCHGIFIIRDYSSMEWLDRDCFQYRSWIRIADL